MTCRPPADDHPQQPTPSPPRPSAAYVGAARGPLRNLALSELRPSDHKRSQKPRACVFRRWASVRPSACSPASSSAAMRASSCSLSRTASRAAAASSCSLSMSASLSCHRHWLVQHRDAVEHGLQWAPALVLGLNCAQASRRAHFVEHQIRGHSKPHTCQRPWSAAWPPLPPPS